MSFPPRPAPAATAGVRQERDGAEGPSGEGGATGLKKRVSSLDAQTGAFLFASCRLLR
jgi:hypothetical protein